MEEIAAFFEFKFTESLLQTSFAGTRFDSNLSSRERSMGKIIKIKPYDKNEHLTPYEYNFIAEQFYHNVNPALKGFARFKSFFKLLNNELPDKNTYDR